MGDSLIGQTRTSIAHLLGDLDVDIRGENRTTVGNWSVYLPDLIERESPDVLVLALGTNDNLAYEEPPGADLTGRATAYAERVDALLDMTAGVPCRVWIGPSSLGFDPRYLENAHALNAALEMELIHHGVRFVSWAERMVSGRAVQNEWMRGDSIHLADRGQFAYAALTAEAARDGCS